MLIAKDYLYLSICQISSKYLVESRCFFPLLYCIHRDVSYACERNERSDHISSNDTIMVLYKKMCLLFLSLSRRERKERKRRREREKHYLSVFFQRSNQRIFLCSIDLLARVCNNRQTILLKNYLNTTPDYYIVSL